MSGREAEVGTAHVVFGFFFFFFHHRHTVKVGTGEEEKDSALSPRDRFYWRKPCLKDEIVAMHG